MENKTSPKKIIWTILFVLLWILTLYFFITKSYKGTAWAVSSIILHFISFIGIVLVWIDTDKYQLTKTNRSKVTIQNLMLMLIGIIYFVFVIMMNIKYEENQLKKYGVRCNARTISTFKKYLRKGGGWRRFVEIEYTYNNKIYHQEFQDPNIFYKIDDTITILISSKAPELYEVPDKRQP